MAEHVQAVLLIHGIGEQRPMATLRSFVRAMVGDNYRSKPDDLSGSLELRRLTHVQPLIKSGSDQDVDTLKTCFFEYYWAYRVRDTSVLDLLGWSIPFVLPWRYLPRRLMPFRLLLWLTLCLTGAAVLTAPYWLPRADHEAVGPLWMWVSRLMPLGAVVATILSRIALNRLGDVPRYLNAAAGNVEVRQRIRADAIELLKQLHDATTNGGEPKYERIVVIGHSLGSVIGFDAISHYWAKSRHGFEVGSDTDTAESVTAYAIADDADGAQKDILGILRDGARWLDEGKKRRSWRVTDFVSIGSPLAHANFLLAESPGDFESRKEQREIPTCPPVDNRGVYIDEERAVVGLHHAAPFSGTVWTNIYFDEDLMGGEVSPCFGDWVKDERALAEGFSLLGHHTSYWPRKASSAPASSVGILKRLIFEEGRKWVEAGNEPERPKHGATS